MMSMITSNNDSVVYIIVLIELPVNHHPQEKLVMQRIELPSLALLNCHHGPY